MVVEIGESNGSLVRLQDGTTFAVPGGYRGTVYVVRSLSRIKVYPSQAAAAAEDRRLSPQQQNAPRHQGFFAWLLGAIFGRK